MKRKRSIGGGGDGTQYPPIKYEARGGRRPIRIQPLPANNPQDGLIEVADFRRAYGFVESVIAEIAPAKVNRPHRGSPVVAPPPVQLVRIVFDCVSAHWFDNVVPNDLNVAWDSAAIAAGSFRVELVISQAHYQNLNQRLNPIFGNPLPPVAEGTWWDLEIPLPPDPNTGDPILVTFPPVNATNPVSTILSSNCYLFMLTDLGVPHNLVKLRMFSHGWVFFQPPDSPPYPGR